MKLEWVSTMNQKHLISTTVSAILTGQLKYLCNDVT